MSQWKLPIIQSKKQFGDDEDYNFVNKDKKKSKDQSGALSMIQQLKYKIEQQKKQIDNRNTTIMGLQRNFQSLSGILKHQKAQSASLKAQLENLRQNSETGDKRALEFHQKSIILQNQNKMLKQQLGNIKKSHSQCFKIANQAQIYKNKIAELQQVVDKFSSKLDGISQQKRNLENELAKSKSQQKSRRQLQQRIIDLQQQLRKGVEQNNILFDKLKIQQDKTRQAKAGSSNNEAKISELMRKSKEQQSKRKLVEQQNSNLKKQIKQKIGQFEQLKKNSESLDLYSKMRAQQQERLKQQLKLAKIKQSKLSQQLQQLKKYSQKQQQIIKVNQKQIELLRSNVNKLGKEVQKLTEWVGDLNTQLDASQVKNKQLNHILNSEESLKSTSEQKLKKLENQLQNLNTKVQSHHKYIKYFKQIDSNQPNGVVITNNVELQRMQNNASDLSNKMSQIMRQNGSTIDNLSKQNETMKKYINSLEAQVNLKTKQINEKNKIIRNLQSQQKKLAETIAEQRTKTEKLKKQSEEVIMKSQKQIQQQHSKSERYKKMLKQYQAQQQKLKKLMAKQQQQIRLLSKAKQDEINQIIRQKQLEIQKQKKNNKLLWTDNKKLKQMEQKLREQAEAQMQEIQDRKREEIEKLKRQLQKRYDQQLNLKQQEQSNSNELKKILMQKAQQIKIITENHNKAKGQVQFYKNRNKQLEGVVSRAQKAFKEQLVGAERQNKTLKDQIASLQKQNKTNKQVIGVLDKKMSQINLVKQQIQKKCKYDVQKLNEQLQYLKQKYEGQKIEQKIALIKKSIVQFDTTLKAIGNSLSCNYCVEPVKQCIRLKQCGHIYCKKCKAGYQPNCGECKKSGTQMNDKVIDDTISKAQYMKIILNTVKEDLGKISL